MAMLNSKPLQKKRLALFLMSQKGYETLKTICSISPEMVDCVISSQDRNVERDYYVEIRELCSKYGIVFRDKKQKHEICAPYSLAVSWRWLINPVSTKLIVFHDSLLPKYRGFNPLVSALINGENKVGVSAIFADKGYDTGRLISQVSCKIKYPIKISRAIELVCSGYRKLTERLLKQIKANKVGIGVKQNESLASYSLWRNEDDYRIDWAQDAFRIKRFVDAVGVPYRGAYSLMDNKKVRVTDVDVLDDVKVENRTPGKVLFVDETGPVIVCGTGLVRIKALRCDSSGMSILPLKRFRTKFV